MQITKWDFLDKGTRTSTARLFFVWKVSLCNLYASIIFSVPFDWIVQFPMKIGQQMTGLQS